MEMFLQVSHHHTSAKNRDFYLASTVCLRDFKQIIIKYDKIRLNLSTIEKQKDIYVSDRLHANNKNKSLPSFKKKVCIITFRKMLI